MPGSLSKNLASARRLRNKVIHEGHRFRFDDDAAEGVAAAAVETLALIQRVAHSAPAGHAAKK